MLTKTMLNLFENIDPLQAEKNEKPNRKPASWPSKGKIWQNINKITDQEDKTNIYVCAI